MSLHHMFTRKERNDEPCPVILCKAMGGPDKLLSKLIHLNTFYRPRLHKQKFVENKNMMNKCTYQKQKRGKSNCSRHSIMAVPNVSIIHSTELDILILRGATTLMLACSRDMNFKNQLLDLSSTQKIVELIMNDTKDQRVILCYLRCLNCIIITYQKQPELNCRILMMISNTNLMIRILQIVSDAISQLEVMIKNKKVRKGHFGGQTSLSRSECSKNLCERQLLVSATIQMCLENAIRLHQSSLHKNPPFSSSKFSELHRIIKKVINIMSPLESMVVAFKKCVSTTHDLNDIICIRQEKNSSLCFILFCHVCGDFLNAIRSHFSDKERDNIQEITTQILKILLYRSFKSKRKMMKIIDQENHTNSAIASIEEDVSLSLLNQFYKSMLTLRNNSFVDTYEYVNLISPVIQISLQKGIFDKSIKYSMQKAEYMDQSELKMSLWRNISFVFIILLMRQAEILETIFHERRLTDKNELAKTYQQKSKKYKTKIKQQHSDHGLADQYVNFHLETRLIGAGNKNYKFPCASQKNYPLQYMINILAINGCMNVFVWHLIYPNSDIQSYARELLDICVKLFLKEKKRKNGKSMRYFSPKCYLLLVKTGFVRLIFEYKERFHAATEQSATVLLDKIIEVFVSIFFSFETKSLNDNEASEVWKEIEFIFRDSSGSVQKRTMHYSIFLLRVYSKTKISQHVCNAPVNQYEFKKLDRWIIFLQNMMEDSKKGGLEFTFSLTKLMCKITKQNSLKVLRDDRKCEATRPPGKIKNNIDSSNDKTHIWINCNDKPVKILMECPSIKKIERIAPSLALRIKEAAVEPSLESTQCEFAELHVPTYKTAEELMSHIEGGRDFLRSISPHYDDSFCFDLLSIACTVDSVCLRSEYIRLCSSRITRCNAITMLQKAVGIKCEMMTRFICEFITRDKHTFEVCVMKTGSVKVLQKVIAEIIYFVCS